MLQNYVVLRLSSRDTTSVVISTLRVPIHQKEYNPQVPKRGPVLEFHIPTVSVQKGPPPMTECRGATVQNLLQERHPGLSFIECPERVQHAQRVIVSLASPGKATVILRLQEALLVHLLLSSLVGVQVEGLRGESSQQVQRG